MAPGAPGGWAGAARNLLRGLLLALSFAPLLTARAAVPAGASDSDGDGYPDALELSGNDRSAFADWFAAIAESQYYGLNERWAVQDRDCAGLLRFAFRETLSKHNDAWLAGFTFLPRPSHGEVRAYGFPAPLVSRSLFRVAPGPYRPSDVEDGLMVGRTGAQYLANYSSFRVSRDWRAARRGDLLFFLRPQLGSYHSMIYLGDGRVVYHTGASATDGGEVRLVTVETLSRHPDPAFHPTASNPNFLGVYRWNILE